MSQSQGQMVGSKKAEDTEGPGWSPVEILELSSEQDGARRDRIKSALGRSPRERRGMVGTS